MSERETKPTIDVLSLKRLARDLDKKADRAALLEAARKHITDHRNPEHWVPKFTVIMQASMTYGADEASAVIVEWLEKNWGDIRDRLLDDIRSETDEIAAQIGRLPLETTNDHHN